MNKSRITLIILYLFISFGCFAQELDSVIVQNTKPIFEFKELEFDFGVIETGEKISHVFKFTNTGNSALIITDAEGSCGCTIPYFPKIPILAGEKSEIEVEFNSEGRIGPQYKRITIEANTDPKITYLILKGEALRKDNEIKSDEEVIERDNEIQNVKNSYPNCFTIYPNPASDILQLELKEYIGLSAIVEIHNNKGEIVMNKEIEHISRESTHFDVSNFSPGIYLVTIQINNNNPMFQCLIITDK